MCVVTPCERKLCALGDSDYHFPLKMRSPGIFPCLLAAIMVVGTLSTGLGQEPQPEPTPLPEPKPLLTIRALRATLKSLGEERDAKQVELRSAATPHEKETLALQIKELNGKIAELNLDLESVSTGVDVAFLDEKLGQGVQFDEEFKELVQPMLQELKRATAKPRELENLRSAVSYHKKRRDLASKALAHVQDLVAIAQDPAIKKDLQEIEKTWTGRLEQFTNELTTAEYQLAERLESEDSLLSTLRQGAASFFQTRGKNILVAAVIMCLVFFFLRTVHSGIRKMEIIRKRGSFAVRLADVIYYAVNVILTVFAGLLAFYALGDWMMLGLSLVVLAGLAWTSKTGLPRVYEQTKLMLNLGSVRESERVVYRDVPWEVRRISIYTDLINPVLEGGHLRLPLRDLIPLSSRPMGTKEPFFPCEKGDWVVLADNTVGRVVRQTPEWVQLALLGNSVKTYTVADFLGQTPRNLSHGFRFFGKFGIDYGHQKVSTNEVPSKLRERLSAGLAELVGAENLVDVNVEFANAGASSLDYAVLADFKGPAAARYFAIERGIQRICVDACNELAWVIPFTQITMHHVDAKPEAGGN